MAAQDDRERGGEHGLPNSRIDTDLQSLRDQSSSSHLLSRSLPDLAIHPTSAAAAPYETHVSGDVDTHASSNSNPTPSTPNTTNRHSIRHRRRVQWAISPSSASTVPPQPRNQPENFIPRLSSLDELGIDSFLRTPRCSLSNVKTTNPRPLSPLDSPLYRQLSKDTTPILIMRLPAHPILLMHPPPLIPIPSPGRPNLLHHLRPLPHPLTPVPQLRPTRPPGQPAPCSMIMILLWRTFPLERRKACRLRFTELQHSSAKPIYLSEPTLVKYLVLDGDHVVLLLSRRMEEKANKRRRRRTLRRVGYQPTDDELKI
ncbi:hypothetical protein BS47DRAFT_847159 [Hydnum rufescens UP504]|uniref:Uncharacterized protein n=1 Tax=Hydnum rufescens UP504 TaxID=1448309 RepID=A0A9P6B9X8_9AGAM|nr:hypothetical protein BS47DRAFT_847159 [Hydnum rufescens UP504]